MRHFQGYVFKERGYWMARVCVTDSEGKRRNLKTSRKTKTEAKLALERLLSRAKEIAGGLSVEAEQMTFAELAEHYKRAKLIPAEYRGEKKVRGMKSLATAKLFLSVLTDHFGRRRIRTIKHADIEAFKNKRLDTKTRHDNPRSIASVNRELQLLRTVFIWAERQGWIEKNPFRAGEPLINRAAETRRTRILSFDEEDRLLAACVGNRSHLRPLIIAAIDTGLRRGELFKLVWADVDLKEMTITVRARNSKTGVARQAIVTDRLAEELRALQVLTGQDPANLVFGLTNTIKHSFRSACAAAKLDDVHFHDLRHCFVTRTAMAGILPTTAMKLAGHQSVEMHGRYLNPDAEAAVQAREALNRLYRNREKKPESEFIN